MHYPAESGSLGYALVLGQALDVLGLRVEPVRELARGVVCWRVDTLLCKHQHGLSLGET